jgi:hypothetical protein
MTPLVWHATEFGRRTECGTYRIVHTDGGWQLLDDNWNAVAEPTRKIVEAQQLAERVAARRRAAHASTQVVGRSGAEEATREESAAASGEQGSSPRRRL